MFDYSNQFAITGYSTLSKERHCESNVSHLDIAYSGGSSKFIFILYFVGGHVEPGETVSIKKHSIAIAN